MNKTELIKSIENGNLEFVSPSEGIQYTISNDCDGWKADGAEISTGLDGGFYTAGIVRATYKKSSVVSVKLKNGVIFEFYAEDVKDWRKGDLCAMIIDNNGTKAIYDDMVIDAVNMDQE